MKRKHTPTLFMRATGLLASMLMVFSAYSQTDYYVSNGGTNANTGLSTGSPKKDIQAAINVAANNDIIHVAAGTYTENITISIGITLVGPNSGIAGTAARGSEAQLLNGTVSVSSAGAVTVDGFQIYQTDNTINIVSLAGGSPATIKNNRIERYATSTGIGVRAIVTSSGSGAKAIENNLFSGDVTGGVFGGHKSWNNAVYVNGAGSTVSISNNTFEKCRTALSLDDFNSGISIAGNTMDNCGTFLGFGGATPTNGQYVLGSNNFKNPVDGIVNLSSVNPAFRLDMTSSMLNGAVFNTLPLSTLFLVEAGMYHRGRSGKNGLVYYVNGREYVAYYAPLSVPFTTVQSAVDYGAAGDIITVQNGTYNARVNITKSLTIQGESKAGTVLNGTGLSAGSGISLANNITNVTIKDLTIQNFPGLTGNNSAGIYAPGGNSDLTISNSVIRNNVNGSGIYANGPINNVLIDGNTISGHTVGARGIVIWNGLKSNISITNNEVFNNNCCGIELQDGTASGVTMTGNNVHDNGDNGIGVVGLQGPGANLVASNTLLNNGRFGIEVKLPNGSGLSSGAGSVVINGNTVSRTTTITDARDIAGIAIFRRGYVAGNNNVDIPVGAVVSNNIVSGFAQPSNSEGFGIVVEGINHTVSGNTVSGNDVGIQRQAGHLPYTAYTNVDGDQTNVVDQYFGRGNSPVTCGVTVTGNSFSSNATDTRDEGSVSGTGIVTNSSTGKSYCSIQAAVDDASAGNTLVATAGTYNENITIGKALTLKGANYGVSCSSGRNPESIINGTASAAITINAAGVTVNGFTVTNLGGSFGILIKGKSNTDIQYNNVTDVGNNTAGAGGSFGVYVQMSQSTGSDVNGVNISNNCVNNIRGGANTSLSGSTAKANNGSGNGIGVGDSRAQSDITGLTISSNVINNISASTLAFGSGGKGAYGIVINVGASAIGQAIDAVVSNNVITGLDGLWAHGVGLEGKTPGADVLNNYMDGFTHHKVSPDAPDASGVKIEDNTGASSLDIHQNSFTNMAFGVDNSVTGITVNAECNWYGSATGSVVASKNSVDVDYSPWLISGTDASPATGFQPAGSSCTGNNNVLTITCPADKTIACGASTDPSNTGNASAISSCGGTSVTHSDVSTATNSCLCNYTVTRTWTATDACGNQRSCSQTITVSGAPLTCSITSTPTAGTYTESTNRQIYMGYGDGKTTLMATATSGSTIAYQWTGAGLSCTTCQSPVFTATASGTYVFSVEVTNEYGCKSTCSITICVLNVTAPGQGKVYICHNGHTLSVSTNAIPAHRNHGDRLGTCDQTCGSSGARLINSSNQISEEVKVYPNPNTGAFNIELPYTEDKTFITVTDVAGKTIKSRTVTEADGSMISFDLSNVAKGLYFIDVSYGEQHFRTKLIIQ